MTEPLGVGDRVRIVAAPNAEWIGEIDVVVEVVPENTAGVNVAGQAVVSKTVTYKLVRPYTNPHYAFGRPSLYKLPPDHDVVQSPSPMCGMRGIMGLISGGLTSVCARLIREAM